MPLSSCPPGAFGLLSETATNWETDKERSVSSHRVLEAGKVKVKVKMPADTVSDEDWVILLLKLLGSEPGPWAQLSILNRPIKETNK